MPPINLPDNWRRKKNLKERIELNYPDSPIMGTGIFEAPDYFGSKGHYIKVPNEKEPGETDREYKKRMKREPKYITVWEEYI